MAGRLGKLGLAACVAALALCLATPSASRAELLEAELTVAGMTCPFCTFGIEKKLRAIKGVRDVTVLLDEGRIKLVLSSPNAATPDHIHHAVQNAGFKLSELELQVRGQLVLTANSPTLDAGNALRLRLLETRDGRTGPLSAETQQEMRAASNGRSLLVRGVVRAPSSEMPELVVEAFREDGAAAP